MEITRYSDKDLKHFKSLIAEKIQKAQNDLALIKSAYITMGIMALKTPLQLLKLLRKVHKPCQKKRIHNLLSDKKNLSETCKVL